MIINTRLFTWKNVLIIAAVAIVAHHFAKGWFKSETSTPMNPDES